MTKVKFGLRYKNYPLPKKVKFWGGLVKIFCKVAAGSSAVMHHEYLTLGFLFMDQATDYVMNFFGEEESLADGGI